MKVREKDYCVKFEELKIGDIFQWGQDKGYFIKVKTVEVEIDKFMLQTGAKTYINAVNIVTGRFEKVPLEQIVRYYVDAVLLLDGKE